MNASRCPRLARFVLCLGACCAGLLATAGGSEPSSPGPQVSPNLAAAKGAILSASSEVGLLRGRDHRAQVAIDGMIGPGYWCTAFDNKGPHWLEIKFGGEKRFNEVVLHLYDMTRINSCQVQRWDAGAWTPVAKMGSVRPPTSGFSPAWEFSDAPARIVRCRFPAVTSDRVRLSFEKDSSVRLYEVEVLDTPDEANRVASGPPQLDRQASLVRIAFGRPEGGPAPGWLPVAAQTRYDAKQGVGWVGDGKRADGNRFGGAPFAQKFVAGWGGPGRLRVDLPPGRYVAALFSTDHILPVQAFQVEGPGLAAGRPIATVSRGAWDARRFHVEAGANGLELTFRGEVAWLVNALLIAPESNLDAMLSEADRLEEQLAFGSPELMTKHKMIAAPAAKTIALSQSDQSRGYMLYAADPTERVFTHSRPEPHQIGRPLAVQATPGEAAAMSLGVVPLRGLFDMRLTATDLAGPSGKKIPAAAVDVRVVRCWPQADKTPNGRGKVQIIPELLELQDRHPALGSPPGTTRQYWITVRVPDDAAPGQYRGEMRFTAEGVAPATVGVELTVLPFRLHTPPQKTFYTYALLGDSSDAEILQALADMRAHGMNGLASDMCGAWTRPAEGKPVFDAEPLRHVLQLAKQAGLTRPTPWSAGSPIKGIDAPEGSPEWNTILAGLLRQVHQVQQEVGGQELLFYPVDEPFGIEQRLTLAERAMRVARQSGTLRTYCTPADKDIARLGALLDVRCYAIGTVPNVPAAAESTRKAGAAFWWYTNAARELPDVRRYLAGVWFWSTGADGQGYWVYQSRWQRSPAFQDLEGAAHSHDYVAYPDVDGPTPTIQWESIRMGIDDARYLYTLEAAIAARRASPQAAAAEKFLAGLRASMPQSTTMPDGGSILYNCPWKPGQFAGLRHDITKHILALMSLDEKNR